MFWLNKYVYVIKKLKYCILFIGFNLVFYEYDEYECNIVMVFDYDKFFCVLVGERVFLVDDINFMI